MRFDKDLAVHRGPTGVLPAGGLLDGPWFHRTESRDYLVSAEDLVLGGVVERPKAGDRIRETEGEQLLIYEVMAPGGEPPWRWSDRHRRTLRIHTKYVGTERSDS
jgi:mono/diheme cytochrome c family protein